MSELLVRIFNKLYDLRNWLICKLAGRSTIVINAHFRNGTMVIDGSHSLIKDTTLQIAGTVGMIVE